MRPVSRRKLGEQQPFASHPLIQHPVGRWVDDTESIAEDADRVPDQVERGLVRHGVEAASHPTDHAQPAFHRGPHHDAAGVAAVGAVVPAPDHRNGQAVEQLQPPEGEEDTGWFRNIRQYGRIGGVARHEAGPPMGFDLPDDPFSLSDGGGLDGRGTGTGNSGEGAQKLERRREGAVGSRAGIEKSGASAVPDSVHQGKRHQRGAFLVSRTGRRHSGAQSSTGGGSFAFASATKRNRYSFNSSRPKPEALEIVS